MHALCAIIIPVECLPAEKFWLLEKLLPCCCAHDDFLCDLKSSLEFSFNDPFCRWRHIECWVLLRIGWRNDWHLMKTIAYIYARIPHWISEICIVRWLQKHRTRPFPYWKYQKELGNNCGGHRIWIQLADACSKHGPANTTKIAHWVGIDSTTYWMKA